MNKLIDLRSDNLGPLSGNVVRAWADAAKRAPGFGLLEDPDEAALIEEMAAMFGLESGVLVPTGTMANQIAIMLHCRRGEGIVVDRGAHIASNEVSSTTGLAGAKMIVVDGHRGHPTPAQVKDALKLASADKASRAIRLVCLENTHNRAGGVVLPIKQHMAVCECAKRAGVAVHVDGARIWNASIATGRRCDELVAGATTVAVNLNKGIAAPLGSLIMGSATVMEEAAALRRQLGGWWRPLATVAAAARAALKDYPGRIMRDHDHAWIFAEEIANEFPGQVLLPETNLVMVGFANAELASAELTKHGVLANVYGEHRLRFAFHGGICGDSVRCTAQSVIDCLKTQSSHMDQHGACGRLSGGAVGPTST